MISGSILTGTRHRDKFLRLIDKLYARLNCSFLNKMMVA